MIRLNMTVKIDVCADDEWGTSRAWVENEVMHKISSAVIDMFEYPLSVHSELQELTIDGEDDESEEQGCQ